MTLFSGLQNKIQYWQQNLSLLSIKGVTPNQWSLLAASYLADPLFKTTHLMVCADQDEAEEVYESLKHLKNVYFYPGHNHTLYSSIISSETG